MKLVRAYEEKGVTIPKPYERTIKILMAPDKEDIPEVMVSAVSIPPGSGTDLHTHDRPELIYVVSGKGLSVGDAEEVQIDAGTAFWVPADEKHAVKNPGAEPLELITVFVPGYTAESAYATCLERAKE